MSRKSNKLSEDLRGAGSLTIEAIIGITDIVESLHHAISSPSGIFEAPDQTRTSGITGMVYGNIRTITGLVGSGIDALLAPLGPALAEKESSPRRETALAVLNGIAGDHLAARNNPLAIPMQFHHNGEPLNAGSLREAIQHSNGRLVIMAHGSSMNDLHWNRQGHDHGAALARDLGIEPIYLHYNTGLHISENGKKLSDLLETIIQELAQFPQSPQLPHLFFIAHSMGGLVARSAFHYGKNAGYAWPNHLRKLIFLGTPHHGAPLEKGGNWLEAILGISPYSAPFSRLGKIRSSGVTDLRYGNVLDEDWQGRDRFQLSGDQRTPVPLPHGVQCYTIAASTAQESSKLRDGLIGDGLVPLNSALGRHKKAELNLLFPESHQWIGRNMTHQDLLNHPQVYETIKEWMLSGNW